MISNGFSLCDIKYVLSRLLNCFAFSSLNVLRIPLIVDKIIHSLYVTQYFVFHFNRFTLPTLLRYHSYSSVHVIKRLRFSLFVLFYELRVCFLIHSSTRPPVFFQVSLEYYTKPVSFRLHRAIR